MNKIMNRVFPKKDLGKVILKKHKGLYSNKDFFRPISIAIQGNNYCSLGTCPGCGISATNNKKTAEQLPKKTILKLLKQAKQQGIFLYYTNFTGEITDDLKFFEKMLSENPEMDAYKINTNCSKFTSLKEAEKIFKKLKKIGWSNTTYIIPTCVLSVGMQEHKVPLQNIVYGIQAFKKVFNSKEATLLLSHYYTNLLYKDTFVRLQKLYKESTGKRLSPSLLKSDPVAHFGRAKNFGLDHFETKKISEWVSDLNCFGYWHKKYICPEIYIHRDGKIYTCPLFEPHKDLMLGDVKKDSLTSAIKRANGDPFLRLISEKGTKGVFDMLKKEYPELQDILVTNRHEACKVLGEYYKKNK